MSRNYSSTAVDTTLTSGITSGATSIVVGSTTGYPAPPFTLTLDAGSALQELVLVTAVGGTTLTVTRGYDSTVAVAHDPGAVVTHSHAAIDFREAGATKDAYDAHAADTSSHGTTGPIVGTTDAQTLTNKTVDLGSNTVTGTAAQFNAAMSDGDFATRAGAETLTNKTIDLPTTTLTPIPWVTVGSFSNSWLNFGAPEQVAEYRKVGDRVEIRGLIKSGSPMNAAAFTLPAGYRPPAALLFATVAGSAYGTLQITAGGAVVPVNGTNTFFSINCSFSVTA